jgi:Uma2 family endonuclease
MSTKTLMTVEEFARMKTADTEDYELVEGELVLLASGTPKHSIIRDNLARIFHGYFRKKPGGLAISETDCRIFPETIRRPDVAVFLEEKAQRIDQNKYPVPFPPDIAVEILSPSEAAMDLNRKVNEYLKAGCLEVWVIDHLSDEMFIHTDSSSVRLVRGDETVETPLLPGLSVRLRDLFE